MAPSLDPDLSPPNMSISKSGAMDSSIFYGFVSKIILSGGTTLPQISLKFYCPNGGRRFYWPMNRQHHCCYCYYYSSYPYFLLFVLFLAATAKSHPLQESALHPSQRTTDILHDDGLHMAVDVIEDSQLVPLVPKYHPNHSPTISNSDHNKSNNGNNINSFDNVNNDNIVYGNGNFGSNTGRPNRRTHGTMEIITRRKRFAAAQTSRWDKMTPDNVLKLKWFISRYTRDMPRSEIRSVVQKSFAMWSTQTVINSIPSVKLQFEEAAYEGNADIVILWAEGDHGDAYKFDGTGNHTNILAHTFYPTYQENGHLNGDIHLDDAEKWVSDGAARDGTSFSNVFIHEIGHSLGLGHSKRADAIMYPIYKKEMLESASFDLDDKCALNWNYIGPTNLCLFVWLMSEVLPRQIEHKMNSQTAAAAAGVDFNIIQNLNADENVIKSKINTLKEQLQESGIPQCSDDNNVRQKFEHLLQKKLDFPIRHAFEYGEVMCNFLAGLRKQVEQGTASAAIDDFFNPATTESPPDYLAILSQPLHLPLRRQRRRLPLEKLSHRHHNRNHKHNHNHNHKHHHHHHHQQQQRLAGNAIYSIFDSQFFSDDFYRQFLKMYVQ